MKFQSAVDPWFHATIAGTAVLLALVMILVAVSGGLLELTVVAASAALAVGLPLWLLFSTDYEIEGPVLRVRCGPFRWSIPLSEIEHVAPSRSWLSSPALSLDRLEIRRTNGKRILVSPRDREGFLAAIGHADRAPSAAEPRSSGPPSG